MNCSIGKLIGRGASAEVFEWGDDKIIKLFVPGTDIFAVNKEFSNASVVWEKGLSVPKPYEQIDFEGSYGIIYEKVIGENLIEKYLMELTNMCVEVKNDVNKGLNIDKESDDDDDKTKLIAKVLYDINKYNGEGMQISQKDSMKNSIKWAPYLSEDEKRMIFKYIDNLPEKDCLCHGDLNPGNIILRNGVPVIIDWMNATRGNPAADAAELITIYKYAVLPPETTGETIAAFDSIREILSNTFVDEYTRLSGISYEEIEAWILPIAAAKLATSSKPDEEKAVLLEVVRKKLNQNY
jgi:hypothetical protein